jgi:hypothetical protein
MGMDLLIVRDNEHARLDFPVEQRPKTLLIMPAPGYRHWIECLRGHDLRYVFDCVGAMAHGPHELKVVLMSRLRVPGYRIYTMLAPSEILAAASEPMPS